MLPPASGLFCLGFVLVNRYCQALSGHFLVEVYLHWALTFLLLNEIVTSVVFYRQYSVISDFIKTENHFPGGPDNHFVHIASCNWSGVGMDKWAGFQAIWLCFPILHLCFLSHVHSMFMQHWLNLLMRNFFQVTSLGDLTVRKSSETRPWWNCLCWEYCLVRKQGTEFSYFWFWDKWILFPCV